MEASSLINASGRNGLDSCIIAKPLPDRGDLPGSIVKMSHHYQPITAILYTRSMTRVAGAIQADRV
jgi:hypothetical protein